MVSAGPRGRAQFTPAGFLGLGSLQITDITDYWEKNHFLHEMNINRNEAGERSWRGKRRAPVGPSKLLSERQNYCSFLLS